MSSLLTMLLGQSKAARDRELAELQLCLIVAMACADGRVHELELEQVHHFVDRAGTSPKEHARLSRLTDELFAEPPEFEDVLHELERYADRAALGERIVDELDHIAHSDDQLDHREEFYVELVRDVFGLSEEYDDAADGDLHHLVQQLALASRRAA
jgi:uncharacterized tellurite resistance protein B-like protein